MTHRYTSPTLTRRMFMAQCAAAPLTLSFASPVISEIALGPESSLMTVSDGFLTLPPDMIYGQMPQDELKTILAAHGKDLESYTPDCNVALYRDGQNTVLFDVGSGPDFVPTAGQLTESLDALGIAPEDVTHVAFTHAHPDHIWGLLDDFDDPVFSEATYLMGRSEWDYWWNPNTVDTIGESRAAFAVGARRRMEVIEDMVQLFDNGQEILPGIAARACYGHTPGHMAFEVRQGNEAAMIVGDAIANNHVAFERPDWLSGTDQNPNMGAQSRKSLLDQIATDQIRMVGFHLPDGGVGRVERAGDFYKFIGETA